MMFPTRGQCHWLGGVTGMQPTDYKSLTCISKFTEPIQTLDSFHAMNRHVALEDFVKLLFVTRMGRLYEGAPGSQYLDATTEAHSIFKMGPPVEREGARIDVASVCDEGFGVYNIGRHFTQAEFQEVAGVATGHEVGHLLVGNWHEQPGDGTLMGDIVFVVVSGGALVRIDGLDDVEWSDEATGRIDLPNRFSVP